MIELTLTAEGEEMGVLVLERTNGHLRAMVLAEEAIVFEQLYALPHTHKCKCGFELECDDPAHEENMPVSWLCTHCFVNTLADDERGAMSRRWRGRL